MKYREDDNVTITISGEVTAAWVIITSQGRPHIRAARKIKMTNLNDRFTFPPIGAFPRPGDIRRGHRAVREGLSNLVSDSESYLDVLKAAYEEFSTEERISAQGTAIGTAMDQTWVMLGVLKGALSLCPAELSVKPTGDHG